MQGQKLRKDQTSFLAERRRTKKKKKFPPLIKIVKNFVDQRTYIKYVNVALKRAVFGKSPYDSLGFLLCCAGVRGRRSTGGRADGGCGGNAVVGRSRNGGGLGGHD